MTHGAATKTPQLTTSLDIRNKAKGFALSNSIQPVLEVLGPCQTTQSLMINMTISLKECTKSYLLVGLQDISSTYKKSLHFYIAATNYCKIKL